MRRVLVLSVMAGAFACGSFGSTEDTPPPPARDAGDDATTAADVITPPPPDGAKPSDGPCGDRTATPIFSADFEANATSPFGFDQLKPDANAGAGSEEFSLAQAGGKTGNGVRVVIEGTQSSHNTWLSRHVARSLASTTRVRLDVDFFVEAVSHDYAIFAALLFDSSDAAAVKTHGIAERGKVWLDEAVWPDLASDDTRVVKDFVGSWHHGTVCVLHERDSNTVRRWVRVDDVVVDDRDGLPLAPSDGFEVAIGAFYTSYSTGQTIVRFDDVELRAD